jgi:hypothetical protein
MTCTSLPKQRRCETAAAALWLAGVGLCREADALPHKLLLPYEPPATVGSRLPRTRKVRPNARRLRAQRRAGTGAGTGEGGLAALGGARDAAKGAAAAPRPPSCCVAALDPRRWLRPTSLAGTPALAPRIDEHEVAGPAAAGVAGRPAAAAAPAARGAGGGDGGAGPSAERSQGAGEACRLPRSDGGGGGGASGASGSGPPGPDSAQTREGPRRGAPRPSAAAAAAAPAEPAPPLDVVAHPGRLERFGVSLRAALAAVDQQVRGGAGPGRLRWKP